MYLLLLDSALYVSVARRFGASSHLGTSYKWVMVRVRIRVRVRVRIPMNLVVCLVPTLLSMSLCGQEVWSLVPSGDKVQVSHESRSLSRTYVPDMSRGQNCILRRPIPGYRFLLKGSMCLRTYSIG